MRARTSALMFLTCFFTEDITALICTLSYLLICSHCVWDREQQYCRFCLSVPYFFYFWSITISQPRMFCSPCKVLGGGFCKRVNSALRQRWSEINLSGCHILGSAMKNKTQCNEFLHMPWTSHYGWQSALVYPKTQVTNGTYWRLHPEAYWKVWCSSFSSANYEHPNIRCDTWMLQQWDLTFSFLILLSILRFII